MQLLRRLTPALRWLVFFSVLMLGREAMAAAQQALATPSGVTVRPLVLSPQERAWIARNPQVIVASVQYPLYLFKDEQGQWTGLSNDILLRLSRMTGLQFVHQESFSTEHLLGLLESGQADMSSTLVVNDERKGFLDFSHAFGGSGWVFVGLATGEPVQSLEALSGKVLALPARHALEAGIRRDYPQIQLRSVKTYAEARALVESGEAQATIENENGAYQFPAGRLSIGMSVDGHWVTDHLAVRKGQPHLLSILNKALEAFPPAELRAIRVKWLSGVVPMPQPSPWQRLIQWACWGGVLAGVFGLISVLWNRRLKCQVERRLKAEETLDDQLAFEQCLINAMPDPVFVRDLEGRLILCNKSYEEYLSTRFDRIQGKRLTEVDILPAATGQLLHAEFIEQLGSRKGRFIERQLTFNHGTRDIYQWTVPFYSAKGVLRGVLGGWTAPRGPRHQEPR
ncbi:transporter substrate-binding domain-containing protein [Pseudomonas sp. RA_35y_Pfl2_P32]|uniref:transporter substrate-binding domain-containing protein n=1 Tax=Pseudomonas sp. RA_35y_Pfl2_P32 TaxID=3088705 RepID=UPI0030DC8545